MENTAGSKTEKNVNLEIVCAKRFFFFRMIFVVTFICRVLPIQF